MVLHTESGRNRRIARELLSPQRLPPTSPRTTDAAATRNADLVRLSAIVALALRRAGPLDDSVLDRASPGDRVDGYADEKSSGKQEQGAFHGLHEPEM